MVNIFIFNEETLDIEFDYPELSRIPEFQALIVADKSEDKMLAKKVFCFIYFKYHYLSPYSVLPSKEIETRARRSAGLEADWIEKPIVVKAAEVYRKLLEDSYPTIKFYHSLKEGFATSGQAVELVTSNLKKAMKALEGVDTIVNLDSIVSYLSIFMDITGKLDKSLETLNKTEQKLMAEIAREEGNTKSGDGKGLFEDSTYEV